MSRGARISKDLNGPQRAAVVALFELIVVVVEQEGRTMRRRVEDVERRF